MNRTSFSLLIIIFSVINLIVNLGFIILVQCKLTKWKGKDVVYLNVSIGGIIISLGYLAYNLFFGINSKASNPHLCRLSGMMQLTGYNMILFSVAYLTICLIIELVASKLLRLKSYIIGMVTITLSFLAFSITLVGVGYFTEMPSKLYCSVKYTTSDVGTYGIFVTLAALNFIAILAYLINIVTISIYIKLRRTNFGVHQGNFESQSRLSISLAPTHSNSNSIKFTNSFMNYYRERSQLVQHLFLFTLLMIPATMELGIKLKELVNDQISSSILDGILQCIHLILCTTIPIVIIILEPEYKSKIVIIAS